MQPTQDACNSTRMQNPMAQQHETRNPFLLSRSDWLKEFLERKMNDGDQFRITNLNLTRRDFSQVPPLYRNLPGCSTPLLRRFSTKSISAKTSLTCELWHLLKSLMRVGSSGYRALHIETGPASELTIQSNCSETFQFWRILSIHVGHCFKKARPNPTTASRTRDGFTEHAVDDVQPSMQLRIPARENEIWKPQARAQRRWFWNSPIDGSKRVKTPLDK